MKWKETTSWKIVTEILPEDSHSFLSKLYNKYTIHRNIGKHAH